MFQPDKLNALFLLLKEMTLQVRDVQRLERPKWQQLVEKGSIIGCVMTALIFVGAVVLYRNQPSSNDFIESIYKLYNVIFLFGGIYMAAVAFSLYTLYFGNNEKRLSVIHSILQHDLCNDARFLPRLLEFGKPTLEYGLVQYQHCWGSTDGRLSLFSGDLRKLGLFPALAAVTVSAASLLKQDSNLFLWVPAILAACCYLLVCIVSFQRERPQQVIALLEFAIRLAEHKASIGDSAPTAVESQDMREISAVTERTPPSRTDATTPIASPKTMQHPQLTSDA